MLAKDTERKGRTTTVGFFVYEFSFIFGGLCIEYAGGYSLPEYRGKHVTGLAMSQAIDIALSEPGISKVIGYVLKTNARSLAL